MAANQLFSFLFDVNLSCSCDNMWLAFDSKLSESITSSVRTTDNMKIPLLFFLDYEQTCTSDCPYTTRDVYSLPHDVFVSTKAFHHCLTSGRYTDQAVQRYFKDKCGYGTLRLSPNQLVMDHMHADSAVVCSREDLVKGPPIFQHFQVKRKSKDELSVNFRLHSYPLPEFRLLTAKKGQNEWTDVLVTQNESRKLWLTKTLRSSADTITEGQILLHNQSPGNRYKFRACNPVDCDSIHFELSQSND
ncbi:unnamed protein product [Soboliphyme baturini]|uniref:TGF_BETA_2 domain-containing protein n=1 Tax=Soboliphyme baturini TaxID=241478 RepID=A0A183INN2_9BILA|nr:unnamed protein product [Soboliphyme baturini]